MIPCCHTTIYLIDLHSLLRGPGLWVGSSKDPELSLDQGAVGQVHSTNVEVDDSVVGAGGCWLHHIWMERKQHETNDPTQSHAVFKNVEFILLVETVMHCLRHNYC